MADFLQTVEADVKAVATWAEAETQTALTFIWTVAKPVFTQFEPVLIQAVLGALSTFLASAAADVQAGTPSYIATVFKQTLIDTGQALLADVENLGDDLLTVLSGLAKTAAAKA